MIDFRKDGHTLEPVWCVAHQCWAPCMRCLVPEVTKNMTVKQAREGGILFQSVDFNRN